MAIAVYFHPQSLTKDLYEQALKGLEAAGLGQPEGRLHHSCFGPDDHLMVYDIWDSPASFEAFGQALMPILQEIGLDPGTPEIMPLCNMIQ